MFIPLVVDTFGGWHKDSLEVITKLGRQVTRQTGKEEEEIVRQLRQRVAVLLVRDNMNMFDSCTPTYHQAVVDADDSKRRKNLPDDTPLWIVMTKNLQYYIEHSMFIVGQIKCS